MRFLLFFVLHLPFAFSEEKAVFLTQDKVRNAVWKLQIPFEGNIPYEANGTGFFIKPHHFITNLHAFLSKADLDLKLDYNFNNENFILLQEGEPVRQLRVKKILAISALYDLALLETEESSDYLTVRENSQDEEYSNFVVLGYGMAELSLKERKQAGNIFREGDLYLFSLNNSLSRGFSGSPVLDKKGAIRGILNQSDSDEGNIAHAFRVDSIIKFISGETGLNCNPFPDVQDCIKQEIKSLHEQAEKSHILSQYQLGEMYEQGEGVEQDFEKAKYWHNQAAKQGNIFAQFKLGLLYEHSTGEEKQAEHWYLQAAKKGLSLAQNNLALMYIRWGDIAKAFHWFNQAAKQELSVAQYNLATLYEYATGEERDKEKDLQQAKYWHTKAAGKGYTSASYSLAVMAYKQRDFKDALKHFTTTAKQGDASSQHNLAVMYTKGEGIRKDMRKAVYWYAEAAKQGYVLSQHNLAVIYEKGIGMEQDFEKAVYWYAQAAEQGDTSSLDNLLDMHLQGKGVEHIEEILDYWRRREEELNEQGFAVEQTDEQGFIPEGVKETFCNLVPIFC